MPFRAATSTGSSSRCEGPELDHQGTVPFVSRNGPLGPSGPRVGGEHPGAWRRSETAVWDRRAGRVGSKPHENISVATQQPCSSCRTLQAIPDAMSRRTPGARRGCRPICQEPNVWTRRPPVVCGALGQPLHHGHGILEPWPRSARLTRGPPWSTSSPCCWRLATVRWQARAQERMAGHVWARARGTVPLVGGRSAAPVVPALSGCAATSRRPRRTGAAFLPRGDARLAFTVAMGPVGSVRILAIVKKTARPSAAGSDKWRT